MVWIMAFLGKLALLAMALIAGIGYVIYKFIPMIIACILFCSAFYFVVIA